MVTSYEIDKSTPLPKKLSIEISLAGPVYHAEEIVAPTFASTPHLVDVEYVKYIPALGPRVNRCADA